MATIRTTGQSGRKPVSEKTRAEDERLRNELRNAREQGHQPMTDDEKKQFEACKRLKAAGFKKDETEGWFNLDQRKNFSRKARREMSLDQLDVRLAEKVPNGEFWVYSYYVLETKTVRTLVSRYELGGLTAIPKPVVNRPAPRPSR